MAGNSTQIRRMNVEKQRAGVVEREQSDGICGGGLETRAGIKAEDGQALGDLIHIDRMRPA